MSKWQYIDDSRRVVCRYFDGGMESCLVGAIQEWLDEGNIPLDPPDSLNPLPAQVTAAQGGIALIRAGLMDAVQKAVSESPEDVRWAWERAQVWERSSPTLSYLSNKAGIDAAQLDDLFRVASMIRA